MPAIRQQKWVFCLQIQEVRESERANIAAAFRAVLAPYVDLIPGDTSVYVVCEPTRYDDWDMKCCTEAWFKAEDIAALPALLEDLIGQAYPGPTSNISAWNSPALGGGGGGRTLKDREQFRDVEI